MKSNIIIIGFMGSGKSTVAEEISRKLTNFTAFDTDIMIENEEKTTISELFLTKGESYFRDKEVELFFNLEHKDHMVLSTGGGFPINPAIKDRIRSLGYIVYLNTSLDCIQLRLKNDNSRPLYHDNSLNFALRSSIQPIKKLYDQRCPLYEDLAMLTIKTDQLSPEEIAKTIITGYNKQMSKSEEFLS